jgi:hypothetical protein
LGWEEYLQPLIVNMIVVGPSIFGRILGRKQMLIPRILQDVVGNIELAALDPPWFICKVQNFNVGTQYILEIGTVRICPERSPPILGI